VGDFAGARANLTEALRVAQILGAESLAASVALSVAENEFLAGDPETALRLALDLLRTYRSLGSGSLPTIAAVLVNMAGYLIALDRYDEGRVRANQALERARALHMSKLIAQSLQNLALVAILKPQVEGRHMTTEYTGIGRLIGFVDACLTTIGDQAYFGLQRERDRALALLRNAIGKDILSQLMAAGATMTEDEAIDQAHAIQ
jgi:hypothetical protein